MQKHNMHIHAHTPVYMYTDFWYRYCKRHVKYLYLCVKDVLLTSMCVHTVLPTYMIAEYMKSTKVQTHGAYEPVCACSEVAKIATDRVTTERRGLWGVSFVRVPLIRCKRRFPIHHESNATRTRSVHRYTNPTRHLLCLWSVRWQSADSVGWRSLWAFASRRSMGHMMKVCNLF